MKNPFLALLRFFGLCKPPEMPPERPESFRRILGPLGTRGLTNDPAASQPPKTVNLTERPGCRWMGERDCISDYRRGQEIGKRMGEGVKTEKLDQS